MYKFNTSDNILLGLSRNKTVKVLEVMPEKGVVFSFRPLTNKEWLRMSRRFNECNSSLKSSEQYQMIIKKVDLKYMEELDKETTEWKELSEQLKEIFISERYVELSKEIEELKIKEREFYCEILPSFLQNIRGNLTLEQLTAETIYDLAIAWINESVTVSEDDQIFFD